MEFCTGGDLLGAMDHCFTSFGAMTFNFIAGVMQQVIRGVKYIHVEYLGNHNDIKPENVLLESKPHDLRDVPRCMIADFGCASDDGTGVAGDPRYNAPELWHKECVTYASDVWSIGVMLFELLSGGLLPFTDFRNISGWAAFCDVDHGKFVSKLQEAMATPGAQPDWSQIASAGSDATSLCQGFLMHSKTERIRLSAALEHPWFAIISSDARRLPAEAAVALHRRCELSGLKRALLNLVASKLQGEHQEYYQKMWDAFDKDGSGTLSDADFFELLASPDIAILGDQAIELHGLVADVDGSGGVEFNEFVAVMFNPDALDQEDLERHLKSIFFGVSGQHEATTFEQLAGEFPAETSRSLIQRLFVHMDESGKGKVSFGDFCCFFATM